jgi:RNA polymerase sigma-70 factor (ECF subfamily)
VTRDEITGFFHRYAPMVFRRARSLLGNAADADEATQEVFQRVLRHGEGFERRCKVSTWLWTITTNYCLNVLRDRARRRELLDEHGRDPALYPPGCPGPDEMLLMRRLLAHADERQAKAAIYVYLDGMSHREAAKKLKMAKRSVGNLLDQFKRWAREYLQRNGMPDGD